MREVPRDGLLESGTIGPGLTLGTDQGGTPHESGFGTPRAVAGPRCGAPRAVAGPRFTAMPRRTALPNVPTQANHAACGRKGRTCWRTLRPITAPRGASTAETAGPDQGERDSTQAGPRTHIARRAEGTEVY